MSYECDIDPDEYTSSQSDWDEFVSTGEVNNPCSIIEVYLTKLCREGSIPAGTYHIEWL